MGVNKLLENIKISKKENTNTVKEINKNEIKELSNIIENLQNIIIEIKEGSEEKLENLEAKIIVIEEKHTKEMESMMLKMQEEKKRNITPHPAPNLILIFDLIFL